MTAPPLTAVLTLNQPGVVLPQVAHLLSSYSPLLSATRAHQVKPLSLKAESHWGWLDRCASLNRERGSEFRQLAGVEDR